MDSIAVQQGCTAPSGTYSLEISLVDSRNVAPYRCDFMFSNSEKEREEADHLITKRIVGYTDIIIHINLFQVLENEIAAIEAEVEPIQSRFDEIQSRIE